MQNKTHSMIVRRTFVRCLLVGTLIAIGGFLDAVGGASLQADETRSPSSFPALTIEKGFTRPLVPKQKPMPKSVGAIPAINVGLSRVPKLGFRSTFCNVGGATGERVEEVRLGSPADRMKLLPGDIIVAVNGVKLTTAESWYESVERAASRDGWVTLKIRSGRTGVIAYRTSNLLELQSR